MSTALSSTIRDTVIRDAKNLPDLVKAAQTLDPDLAASLTEKSLVGSKSVWFPLITFGVTAAVSHLGIGWDEATTTEVSSILAYVVSIGVRLVTRSPIGSILPQKA